MRVVLDLALCLDFVVRFVWVVKSMSHTMKSNGGKMTRGCRLQPKVEGEAYNVSGNKVEAYRVSTLLLSRKC